MDDKRRGRVTVSPFEIIIGALFGGGTITAIMTWVQRRWNKQDQGDKGHEAIVVREIESKDVSEAQLWTQVDRLSNTVSTLQQQRIEDWKTFEQSRRDDAQRCYEVSTKLALSEFHRDLMAKENDQLRTEIAARNQEIKELRDKLVRLEARVSATESRLKPN